MGDDYSYYADKERRARRLRINWVMKRRTCYCQIWWWENRRLDSYGCERAAIRDQLRAGDEHPHFVFYRYRM